MKSAYVKWEAFVYGGKIELAPPRGQSGQVEVVQRETAADQE